MTSLTDELAALYVAERRRLHRLLRRLVGNGATAEDLVHDTFLNLLRRAPAGHIENQSAYLTRSAANLAIDHLRREQAQARHLVEGSRLDTEACPLPLPDTVLQSRQELAILAASIQGLPEKCRTVFILYREHGLTMKQIARHVGISEKTVEKHIMRAMLECRARLRAAGRDV